MKLLKFYSDGFRFLWWGFQVKISLVRGFVIGIKHNKGPWRESAWTHSRLVIYLGFVVVSFEHGTTSRVIPES